MNTIKSVSAYEKNVSAVAALRLLGAIAGLLIGACISVTGFAAPPTQSLYWNPNGGSDLSAGGSGVWNSTSPVWLTSSTSSYTWAPGLEGSTAIYNTLYFGGAGQASGSVYDVVTTLDNILSPDNAGTVYNVNLQFQGNYNMKTSAAPGTTLGSNFNVALNLYADPGKRVSFDGTGGGYTLISGCYQSNGPGIKFAGGGSFDLGLKVTVKQASANARITIGEAGASPTTVTMKDQTTQLTGYRLWVDNGTFNMNAGTISFKNTQTNADRSAIFIGNVVATTAPATFNMNGGLAIATANEAHHGMLFGGMGATSGRSGGTFNLNGGLLTATDIVSEDTSGATTAQFVFNGGTLSVATEATQNQLNRFMSGFGGDSKKLIRIDQGGAFIDTSNAKFNGIGVISSSMTGTGALTKLGDKTLKLGVASTHTGNTTVAGGTLALGVADAIAGSAGVEVLESAALDSANFSQTFRNISGAGSVMMGTGSLTLNNSASTVFSGSIGRAASAALVKSGTGTLVLGTGANLGGGININEGGLQGSAAALASAATSIVTDAGGRVVFDVGVDDSVTSYGGVIGGLGKIEKVGAGTLTLTAAQSYSGGVIASAGAIRGDTGSLRGDIVNNATVIFDQISSGTYLGMISGSGALEKTGAGALTLAAASGHTGETRVLAGALAAGASNLLAASSGVVVDTGATLDFGGHNQVLNNLAGSGSLAMGAGNLTINVSSDDTATFAGVIAGAGGLVKTGAGIFILAGANTYGGNTQVSDGSLYVNNATAQLTGNIIVDALATFGGEGTVGAAGKTLTLSSDSILDIGVAGAFSAQTLTVNSNITFAGATLGVDLFDNNTSDRLVLGAGASLSVSGNNIIDIGNFTSGTFNIGNVAALKDGGASLAITLRGQSTAGGRQSINSGTDAAGNLILTTIASKSREMVWTGSGNATWNTADVNWNDAITPGDADQFASGDRVIFDSTSDAGNEANRTITIGGAYVTVSDMFVRGNGSYTFDGASIIADAASVINVPDTLTGATGKLVMQGTGTLTLANSGTNHFQGGIELQSGVLMLDSPGAIGNSAISIAGSVTDQVAIRIGENADDIRLGGVINLGMKGLVFDTQANDATIAGAITGNASGAFIKNGTGTLTLSAAGDYLGATEIRKGTLRAGVDGAFAFSGTVEVAAGAALDMNDYDQRVNNLTGAGLVHSGINTDTIIFAEYSEDGIFSGTISGAGSFAKSGTATLTLSGQSLHTGTTAVLAGVLKVTAADALVSNSAVAIDDGGTLDISDQNQTLKNLHGSGTLVHGTATLTVESTEDTEFLGTLAAGASGAAGSFVKTGAATLTLGGSNAFTGGALINSGTIIAKTLAALGSGAITLADAGAGLRFDGAAGDLVQAINGAANMIDFTGASRVRLSANNTIAGIRAQGAGTVVTAAHTNALGGATAAVSVTNGAALEVATPGVLAGNVTIAGGILLFALNESGAPAGSLNVGSLVLSDAAEIAFSGPVASGRYSLVSGNVNLGERGTDYIYDPALYGVQITIDENGRLIAYKQTINPSKDLALLYDSINATTSAIYSRMSEGFLLPLVERTQNDKYSGLWFKGIGTFADYENNAEQIGHRDHSYGVIAGYDQTTRGKRFLGGLYVGVSNASIDATDGASVDGNMQFGGVYGTGLFGPFYAGADVSGGWMKADTVRPEGYGKVSGNYDLDYFASSMEMGFVLRLWEKGALRPAAALHYMNARYHDQHEYGPGALHVEDFDNDVVQSLVSLQAFQEFKMPWGWSSMIDAMFGWRQTLTGNGMTIKGSLADDAYTVFSMDTAGFVRGSTVVGIGFRTMATRGTIFALRYDLEATSGCNRHTVSASLTFRW